MAQYLKVAGGVGKRFWTIRRIFFWGILSIIFFVIFANAIAQCFQQKSAKPLIDEVGSRFLRVSLDLEEASLDVIERQGAYEHKDGFFDNSWSMIKTYSHFFVTLFIFYAWIKMLMFIWRRTPFSDKSGWFAPLILSLFTFYFIEAITLVVWGAIDKTINNPDDAFNLLLIPVKSFVTFFRAVPYLLQPASDLASKVK